jgi:hypothetical protein
MGEAKGNGAPALIFESLWREMEEVPDVPTHGVREEGVLNGLGSEQGVQALGKLLELLLEDHEVVRGVQRMRAAYKIGKFFLSQLNVAVEEDTMAFMARTRQ